MQPSAFVYILASERNGTLYTGSTVALARRIWEHRNATTPGFTSAYRVHRLVWYEDHAHKALTRQREYAIKRWRRAWKLALIEAMNPDWRDLYLELNG